MMSRRVAVIGAGGSGLACIKCCLDEGLQPVCFESSDDMGGLWRFKENPEADRASIYHSVIINTSKEMLCFSDFPVPAHFPNFMHNSLIMDYFRMYADHFKLTKHIHFNTKVLQVKQRSDFAQSGQWDVETENKDGKKERHIFDAIMICIGHHCQPNLPLHDFPGIETFKGQFFHSRDYKTPEQWRDKKVVVIGIGNSGGDIAVELSKVTKQLYLSTRRGAWVMNRVEEGGLPRDTQNTRVRMFKRKILPFGYVCSTMEKRLNSRFNHSLYNLKPKHRLLSQHPTVNDDLPNRILSGVIQVRPNVRRFNGSSVEFDDGSVVEDVSLVVFATGYRFSFPFLTSQVLSVSDNKASLYKYMFPPELQRHTLAIIGQVQPLGSIMPISEMQARWATRVFKGCIKLPSGAAMMKDIELKREALSKRYVTSQRHTIQVDYIPYMDEIAEQVGVRPNILKLLLTDPRVGFNVLVGPCTSYQYRLQGPGKWAGARQAILTQWERVAQPMQTRPCHDPEPSRSFLGPVTMTAAVVGVALYISRNKLPSFLQVPSELLERVKGIDSFEGRYLHSWDYHSAEGLQGKRVVVIGIGNSGGDIAVDISRVAEKVYLSTRSGAWVVGRVGRGGLPGDLVGMSRMDMIFQRLFPNRISRMVEKKLNAAFCHKMYGLQPKHGFFAQIPVVNDDLPARIITGRVRVKPNVREFRGSSVVFVDGTILEKVDVVVFATGYNYSFPFLPAALQAKCGYRLHLYKHVFPPSLTPPTLAVVGFVHGLGYLLNL